MGEPEVLHRSIPSSKLAASSILLLLLMIAATPGDASSPTRIEYSANLGRLPSLGASSFVHLPGAPGWRSQGLPLSFTSTRNGEYAGGPLQSRLLFRNPIELKDQINRQPVSFSTTFVASIFDPTVQGYASEQNGVEGLVFILVPDAYTLGAGAGCLGLLDVDGSSSNATKSHTFGVEIDTKRSQEFGDPEFEHIGIDVGSLISSAVAPTPAPSALLGSRNFQMWVEYHNPTQLLEIRIEATTASTQESTFSRPKNPTLAARMNFSAVLQDFMYVGFSSAVRSCPEGTGNTTTGGCTRATALMAWTFETFSWDSNATVVHLPTLDGESLASRNRRTISVFFVVVGIAVLVAAALYFYFRWDHRRRWKFDADANLEAGPHRFSYEELSIATKGFSPKQALGRGGFGSVYKGFLPGNKMEVAVKRVAHDSKQGEREFLAEVHIIGRIRHRNLVRLQGWCHEKNELLLVYDYLSGGSLDMILFKAPESSGHELQNHMVLSWENRMKAMRGIAAAVAYLHDECEERIVHRDIKASNVMLDAKFVAKLGDFGLARAYQHSLLDPQTTAVAGTFGYLAPEVFRSGKATHKTDVYSYGVFLLEVACGRRPVDPRAPEEQVVLVDWVWELFSQSRVLEAADSKLFGQFDHEEMSTVMSLALVCCHADPEDRPSMRQVVMILSRDMGMPPMPKSKPTIDQPLAFNLEEDSSTDDSWFQQTVDNSDLQRSKSSSKYSRMKPMDE